MTDARSTRETVEVLLVPETGARTTREIVEVLTSALETFLLAGVIPGASDVSGGMSMSIGLAGTIAATSTVTAAAWDTDFAAAHIYCKTRVSGVLAFVPPFDQQTDHAGDGVSKVIEQFKSRPKLAAALTAYLNQAQALEDAFFELLSDRWIDSAEGAQLDGLGQIVNLSREGRDDDEYRYQIRIRIDQNLSEGTPEEIISVMSRASDSNVELMEYPPASLAVRIISSLDLIGDPGIVDLLYATLNTIKPAGVGASLIYATSGTDELFRFDSGPGYDRGHYAGAI